MPMRIRQVKPTFWSDAKLAELAAEVRLTYIGLWMIADDGGWFRWDPPQVAYELFGYDDRVAREVTIIDHLDRLIAAERVVIHRCGHANIPTLPDHQRLSGETRKVLTIQREHGQCPGVAVDPTGAPWDAAGTGVVPGVAAPVWNGRGMERVGKGKESNGIARSDSLIETPSEQPTTSEFRARVPKPS